MPFTNRRLVLALLLTVILAGACSESGTNPPPPPPGPGALAGSIYQRLNPELPLEGAELSWGGASAQSGADGSYTLSPDATGSDSLRVSLDGFVGESRWVTLGEDDQQHSFTLLPYDTVPPPAPLAFGAATEDGQFLRLTWTAPADSSDLAGYWLTKSPGDPQAQRFDISVNSWLDLGVSFGRDYSYRLSSVDASGNLSAPLEVVDAVNAPPVPSFLEFLPTGDYGHVNLRWNANDEDDFAFYRLYRRDGGLSADSLNTLVYSTANAGDTLFTDTGVVANALYTYRLYTVDSAGTASTQPSQSQARGAAQRFYGEDFTSKTLLSLPGTDHLLLSHLQSGRVLELDADAAVQGELAVPAPLSLLVPTTGGRVWGVAPGGQSQDATLVLLDTAPLAQLRQGTLAATPGALAWLGGDSLVLAPAVGGAPLLVDGLTFTVLDTLQVLGDLASGARLAADPDGRQLFAAETQGQRRLLRVDLSGPPVVEDSTSLEGFTIAFQRDGAGHLLLAALAETSVLRVDETDFGQTETLDVTDPLLKCSFSGDGTECWIRPSVQARMDGYALDWTGGTATSFAQYQLIDEVDAIQRLHTGSRVAALMVSYWVSVCDVSRSD